MRYDIETNMQKKTQAEMMLEIQISLSQIKSSTDNLTNRMVHRKGGHQDLKTRYRNWYIQLETTINLNKKYKENMQELWDIVKRSNILIMGMEGE